VLSLPNNGKAALSIPANGSILTGANAADFAQINNCRSSLAAGTSSTVTVTFTPSVARGEGVTVNISGDAGSGM
jgi:hypothetical protein